MTAARAGIAAKGDAAGAEPVDQRAGEGLDQDIGQHLGEAGDTGENGVARGGEHQPGNRHHRKARAGQRDDLGQPERDEGALRPPHRSSPPTGSRPG